MYTKISMEPVIMDSSIMGTTGIEDYIKRANRVLGGAQYKLFVDGTPYWVNTYNSPRRAERILSFFPESINGPIVEVGSSEGNVTKALRQKYPDSKLTVLEINTEFQEQVSMIDGVDFIVGDGYSPRRYFQDSSVGLYLMMANFAYGTSSMQLEKVEEVLSEVNSVLMDNGQLIISDEFSFAAFRKEDQKLRLYSHDRLNRDKNYVKILHVLGET
jgi:phospholipid N-methyltransferase